MFSRITSYALTLLLGVPLCWCCWMGAPAVAAEAESCPACKHTQPESGLPAAPATPAHDKPCCLGLTQRNLSPDVAAAPHLVLVDLQVWVWMRPEVLLPPSQRELFDLGQGATERGPPRPGAPLFVQHCALLL
ncbi:MAG: hypothetical protein U0984_18515 [Prosthecobacter sp.]|nr:hypothetical protein [Prosthecobacter sp.]